MSMKARFKDKDDLDKHFETTIIRWREKDPNSFGKKVVFTVRALYRQATTGDAPISLDRSTNSELIQIWNYWDKLRGTSKDVAKRRYISFLYSIDKSFVDPISTSYLLFAPIDSCHDSKTGLAICARCNTVVGCNQPLLNETGNLKLEDDFEKDLNLLKIGPFISWYEKYERQQQCSFGLHIPIANVDSKKFHRRFNKTPTNGFKAYDPHGKMIPILKWVMNKQFQILYNLQQKYKDLSDSSGKDNFRTDASNLYLQLHNQNDVIKSFQKFFLEKVGVPFSFEVTCERKTSQCHARRIASGGENHTHPLTLIEPVVDFRRFETALKLREEVIELNASPITGSLRTEDRCRSLVHVIASTRRKQHSAVVAHLNYLKRANSRVRSKEKISTLSRKVNCNALEISIANGDCENMLKVISGNGFVDYEMSNGLTPLIKFTILSQRTHSQRLVRDLGANVDFINSLGMTALSWACKRDDEIMVHTLLNLGAKPHYRDKKSFTPIEISVRHGRIKILEIIFDTIKGLELFSLTDVLNQFSSITGDTLLIVCAKHRLKEMAKFLIENGANVSLKSENCETALSIACKYGWKEMILLFRSENKINRTQLISSLDHIVEKQNVNAAASATNALKIRDLSQVCELVKEGLIHPDFELTCGETPLLCAIRSGDLKIIVELLRNGCDPCYTNRNGRHALIQAADAENDNMEIGQMLLDFDKSCLDIRDLNGNSALFFSSKGKNSLKLYHLLSSFHSDKKNDLNSYTCSSNKTNQFDRKRYIFQQDISDESWKWRLSN